MIAPVLSFKRSCIRVLTSQQQHLTTFLRQMATGTTEGLTLGEEAAVKSAVSKYYGETLQGSSDLKTSACCTAKAPAANIRKILSQLPTDIVSRYYGCGSPFPVGLEGSGLRVLDLGCGTGRDCYVCAALVGEKGFVTGIDMTDAQLAYATQHSAAWQQQLGYAQPNMRFVKGAIEQLAAAGIAAGSVDVIVSNCVINLSADKPAVLREAYRALADGGEVFFSDVYCDRRLPGEVRAHEVLLGECLGGALAVNDFVRLCTQVGFTDPRVLDAAPIDVHDPQLKQLLGDATFYSVTFRLFKLPGQLEPAPQEDYGQTVTYTGSIPGAADAFVLDSEHTFPAGVPVRVSGNTAAMCSSSWLGRHFKVSGSKQQHLGQFTGSSSSKNSSVLTSQVDGRYVAALAAAATGSSCCAPAAQPAQQQQQACGNGAPSCCPTTQPAGGSCCPQPQQQQQQGSAPTASQQAVNGSCCPPQPKATSSCCPPRQETPSGCCSAPQPKASGGCCAPAQPQQKLGGCCPPKQQ